MLKVGMQLPVQSHSTIYVADWELEAGPEDLVRVALAADWAGFHYVAVCDHVAVPAEAASRMGTFWTDPVATLGMLAGVTRRTRLLSHVYVPAYRHPLVTAKSFATLDWLSGGRVIVGVGAGHSEGEFAAVGADYEGRGAVLDDALQVIDAALRDEYPKVSTDSFTVDGTVGLQPRPVQQPRPPIWIGGSSRRALRRAAQWDGWLPQGTRRRDLPDAIAYLRQCREAAGLGDQPIDIGANALVADDASAEQTAAYLESLRAIGVTNVQLKFNASSCDDLVEQIERFGVDVAPLL